MRSKFQTLVTVCIVFFIKESTSESKNGYTTLVGINLKANEPIHLNETVEKTIFLEGVCGSIGVKTLSTLKDTESLVIRSSNIESIEDGAICSLSKLKLLEMNDNRKVPLLTHGILRSCFNLEYFYITSTIELNSLTDMINLRELRIHENTLEDFNKQYISQFKELDTISLSFNYFDNVEEGLFCPSLKLKSLSLIFRQPTQISQSLFAGCSGLKILSISGTYGVSVADGQYPFSNLPHLRKLHAVKLRINHLTKDFLNGLPNLERISFFDGNINQVDTDAFEGTPNLKYLFLSSSTLKESDLEALHSLRKLEELKLFRVGLTNVNVIKGLPNLKKLSLTWNSISKFDIKKLKKNLPNLRHMDLTGNKLDSVFKKELLEDEELKVTVGIEH